MRSPLVQLGVRLGVLALVSLGLAGCGGAKKFSADDFKKVEKGMTEDKVTELLGKPIDSAEAVGVKRLWWKADDNYYSASFKEGKVSATEGPSTKADYEVMKAFMAAAPKITPTAPAVSAGPDNKDAVAALKKANVELGTNPGGNVNRATVTDRGPDADAVLVHLKGLPSLEFLFLQFSGVSDEGLKHLSGLTNLKSLYLTKTRITDAGLEHLKGLTGLTELRLSENDISDKALANLSGLKNLKYLYIEDTKVSDAGLPALHGLKSLDRIGLANTKVTPAGIAKFKAAVPNCEIKDK